MTKQEAAQKRLDAILAKVPEAQREAVKIALGAEPVMSDLAAIEESVESARTQTETANKTQQEALAYRTTLDKWYQDKLPILTKAEALEKELDALKAKGNTGDPSAAPSVDLTGYMKKAEVEKLLAETRGQLETMGWQAAKLVPKLLIKHYAEYGQQIDPDTIEEYARKNNVDVVQAFDALTAPARAAKVQKADEDRIAQIRREEREKVIAEMSARSSPYPTPSSSEPSTLGGLGKDIPKTKTGMVDAAVAKFNLMRSQRGES